MKGLSLFASAGIAEMNLGKYVDIVLANELLPIRGKVYRFWHPNAEMICGDITDDTIKNDIIKVVSGYTFEQFNQNSDAIKDTILEDMQNLFGKDYVIGVNFSKLTAQ